MEECTLFRRARLARGLSLEAIVTATRLSPHIAKKIDDGRFAELPPGLYARAYVRAVASVLGLNPDETLSAIADRLPEAPDPFPALREVVEEDERPWREARRRCAAAMIDGGAIALLVGGLVAMVESIVGLPLFGLSLPALLATVAMTLSVGVPYVVIFGGIAGRTPGQRLAGVQESFSDHPIRFPDIVRRAAAAVAAERIIWRRGGERLA